MLIDNWLKNNSSTVNWNFIYNDWQDMQLYYNCWRDLQVHTIIQSVLSLPFDKINVIDLCCGPGTLSKSLLEKDSRINIIAIDANKFLLSVYKNILKNYSNRFAIIESDIRNPDLYDNIHEEIHAVISLTALHWLSAENHKSYMKTFISCLLIKEYF